MNYITHLNKAFAVFCEDERLTPFHVSLYFSLFQYWNMAKFRNPISVSRNELMRASKIGSVNTYIRCMKELDTWQYIKYMPSYNPQKGSQVFLYNFSNSNNNSSNNGSDISNNKGSNKASETQVIPYTNNLNIVNKINSVNAGKQPQNNNLKNNSDDFSKNNPKSAQGEKRKKVATKKESRALSRCERPLLEEIKNYFVKNNYPSVEADKFYNHYESNGWLVGGKTPMKNWEASANNWILNSNKFNDDKANGTNHKAGNLHASTGKDYGEAL